MLDLSRYDIKAVAQWGAGMVVHLPDGTPASGGGGRLVTITLAGMDSDTYGRAERAVRDRLLQRAGGAVRGAPISAEPQDAESIELLVACTLAWDGIGDAGGPLPCTPDNARRLYRDFPFLREQVDRFIADRKNFLPR